MLVKKQLPVILKVLKKQIKNQKNLVNIHSMQLNLKQNAKSCMQELLLRVLMAIWGLHCAIGR